jgi:rsbT co-antagonist protein RsbR
MPKKNVADTWDSIRKFSGIVDRRGRIQFASEDAIKALGYSDEDILQKPFWEASWFRDSPKSQKTVKDGVLGALGGKSAECRVQVFTKEGTPHSVTFNINPLKGTEGDIVGITAEAEPLEEEERPIAEEKTEEPEAPSERVDSILELMEEAYFETDSRDTLTLVSPSATRLLGYKSPEETVGLRTAELWANPDERDKFLVQLSRKGKAEGYQATLLTKDGAEVPVEINARLLLDAKGEMVGSQCVFTDISDRISFEEQLEDARARSEKAAETSADVDEKTKQAVQESEERLRIIFNNVSDAIVLGDATGTIISTNDRIADICGFNPEELIGRSFLELDVFDSEQLSELTELFTECISQKRSVQPVLTAQAKHKDGHEIVLEVKATILMNAGGKPEGFLCTLTDVTERKRNEEALQEAERRYRAVFDNPLNMVFIFDERGVFLDASDMTLQHMGYTREDLGSITFQDVAHPDDLPLALQSLTGSLETGYMDKLLEMRVRTKLGEVLFIETYAHVIDQSEGHFRILALARDITLRKEADAEIRDYQDRLKEAMAKLRLSYEELSTPVVQLWDHVLAMPLIGILDTARVQNVMDVLLAKIVETRAQVVLLDVTGVASMDTQVTDRILQTVAATELLGTECILTGVKPEVAQAMVHIGVDMTDLITKRDMQEGLKYALSSRENGSGVTTSETISL